MERLSRDYSKQPLGSKELIPFEDLVYLFIELNYCYEKISKIVGKSANAVSKQCKKHGLIKPKERQKESIQNYYMETLGVKNPAQLKSSQDKMKKTMLEKYGVENIAFRKETKDKRKQTCLKKYGVDNPAKLEENKQKMKETNLERYGVEYAAQSEKIKEKQQNTMLEKYGCLVPLQNKEIKEKQEQTCLERYGVKNPFQNKQIQEKYYQKLKEKYGIDNIMQLTSSKERLKQTCLKLYGVENPLQVLAFREKQKETMLKLYGVENASQSEELKQKKYDTMRKNGTWPINSQEEEKIYETLITKFNGVERQYNKDPRYPFLCDFYIPDLDLFIEHQGYISHGKHPYTGSEEDEQIVEEWYIRAYELAEKKQSIEENSYLSYINTWTVRDPLKRQTAKENNLNWIEFFSFKEFMDWFSII